MPNVTKIRAEFEAIRLALRLWRLRELLMVLGSKYIWVRANVREKVQSTACSQPSSLELHGRDQRLQELGQAYSLRTCEENVLCHYAAQVISILVISILYKDNVEHNTCIQACLTHLSIIGIVETEKKYVLLQNVTPTSQQCSDFPAHRIVMCHCYTPRVTHYSHAVATSSTEPEYVQVMSNVVLRKHEVRSCFFFFL